MQPIDADNAANYLRDVGWIATDAKVEVSALPGGVSNQVLYVAFADREGEDFVVKQARPQLRVPDAWFCGVERIWREVEVLETCQRLLDESNGDRGSAGGGAKKSPLAVRTPRVLHKDRENFAFAMTAAPRSHHVWKQDLLAGQFDETVAAACGTLLGRIHAASWLKASIAAALDDRSIFDQLRIDPYYRTVARNCPDAAPHIERLIDSVWSHRRSLVHADFSPKNLLVDRDGMMMVDFETGHYGDPAFDVGFFLSHLVLKAVYHAARGSGSPPMLDLTERFWDSYRVQLLPRAGTAEYASLAARAALNFAGCAWARVDGKSRVEYLPEEPWRDAVRTIARSAFESEPRDWAEVLTICRQKLPRLST